GRVRGGPAARGRRGLRAARPWRLEGPGIRQPHRQPPERQPGYRAPAGAVYTPPGGEATGQRGAVEAARGATPEPRAVHGLPEEEPREHDVPAQAHTPARYITRAVWNPVTRQYDYRQELDP